MKSSLVSLQTFIPIIADEACRRRYSDMSKLSFKKFFLRQAKFGKFPKSFKLKIQIIRNTFEGADSWGELQP